MDRELKRVLLRARDDVYSLLNGANISNRLGRGYDFAELREYNVGDDIRDISWINSAKFGEHYIKKMYEERELNIAVCSLVDGRSLVGDKIKTLNYLLAILGYSSIAQNSSLLQISILGGSLKMEDKTKEIESVDRHIETINNFNPLGARVDYNSVQTALLNAIQEKSLLFIIGDFLDMIDLSILAQKHEIVAIIVRDKIEENPIISSSYQLINPQTNQNIDRAISKKAIEHYRAKLMEHDNKLLGSFASQRIRYTKIYGIDEVVERLNSL